jgi:hypothetical protein
MSSIYIVERLLLRETNVGGRLLRVIRNDGPSGFVWLFDIANKEWPFPIENKIAVTRLNGDPPLYRIEHEDPWPSSVYGLGKVTATDKKHNKHWSIVSLLIGDDEGRGLLHGRTRGSRIVAVAEAEGLPRNTVKNLLLRFWQRGMTKDSLRPDYANCGGPGKLRNSRRGVKLGRPRSISPGIGAPTDENMRAHLTIAADYYLGSKKKLSQQDALDSVVGRFYKVTDAKPGDEGELQDCRPTLTQFQYFLKTNYSHHRRYRARLGRKKFETNARGLGGSGDQNTQGPGDMFQVDATIADIYLVSKLDRNRIVGRPTIYFTIDVWSRLITGMYVGFEGPSWIGAMMALVNMVTPKVEYCAQFGIEINEDDWPSHHAPRYILADRGELKSCALGDRITDVLNIQIGNASPGRADLKAVVERRFGIVQPIFRPFVPGYVEKDHGERGARDYRLDAELTLNEFTKYMIYAVLEHNSGAVTNIKTPVPMTTAQQGPIPIERWNWGIANRSGKLRKLAVDRVALNVMPRDQARVTERGIQFKGGFYTSKTARQDAWLSLARNKGTWIESICYDPRSLNKMYLLNSDLPNGFEACDLMKPSEDLIEVSLFEYEEAEHAGKVVKARGEARRQAARIRTDEKMAQIASEAKRETLAARDPDLTRSQRLAGIRENKSIEKAVERRSEVFDLAPDPELPPSIVPKVDASTRVDAGDDYAMDLLARIRSNKKR